MRISAFSCCLIVALLIAPACWAQSETQQHLSAEEFLAQDAALAESTPPAAAAPNGAAEIAPVAAPVPATETETKTVTDAATTDAEAFLDEMPKAEMENRSIVRLRTIDKLSARTHTFDIPVGKTVKFSDALFIKARACRSASPLDSPENAAFLQVWERLPQKDLETGEDSRWIFSGWMFSSNPSLSAMEHPVYDVWVITCKNDATVAQSETYSAEKVPETAVETATVPAEAAAAEAKAAAPAIATHEPEPAQMAPVAPVSGGTAAVPALQELPGSFEDGDDE